MFNFITTNQRISFFKVESGISSFSLSRFLEFTPDSIKNTLQPIDDESLALVEKLPVLFVSQPVFHADGACFKSVVRTGEIVKLELNSSMPSIAIDVEFKITHDFWGGLSVKSTIFMMFSTWDTFSYIRAFGRYKTWTSIKR